MASVRVARDGRGRTLLEQVLLPIEKPLELNVSVDTVVARLSREPERLREFRRAFGQLDRRASAALLYFQSDTAAPDADARRSGRPADSGPFAISGDSSHLGAFKTPTRCEVERTAPSMHDGSIATLEEVIEFYDDGGIANPFLDSRLKPLGLTSSAKRALVAFLSR